MRPVTTRSRSSPVLPPPAADFAAEPEPEFGEGELKALGTRLRELRELKGWSMKRLADESGVSIAALQRIEVGSASAGLATAVALCDALGLPLERLVRATRDELARKFNHVAVPKRPSKALDLTGALTDAHVQSRVVVVRAGASQQIGADQATGAMFVFVLAGALHVAFDDGGSETLGTGDALHLGMPERMEWHNAADADAQVLCIVDTREPGGSR